MRVELATRAWWIPALVGLLFVLLPVLAWLQLRWIDGLSASETARLSNFVSTGVDRVALDLERELLAVEDGFREVRGASRDELALALVERARVWRSEAREPGLVRSILWVDPGSPEHPRSVDGERRLVEPIEWSPELADWQRLAGELAQAPARAPLAVPAEPPGLLVPLLAFGPQFAGRTQYALLLLEPESLERRLLSRLVEQHLGQAFGPPVQVVITHGGRVRFRSEPGLSAADLARPDACRRLEQGRLEIDSGDGDGAGMFLSSRSGAENVAVVELELPGSSRGAASPASAAAPRERGALRTLLELPAWELRARHAAGSIPAAVAAVRRRNLWLGFGVLGVLFVTTCLLFGASRRARRLARSQMEFVAGVTHELRTPLTVIRSAAENLKDNVVVGPEQVGRYGHLIHDEALRLSGLVEQALALAGAGSAQARVERQAVDLGELLARVVRRTGAGKDAPIELDVPADAPAVLADPRALEQVLDNLLGNALKYAGEGTRIGVRVRSQGEGDVQVAVWDEGPGIPRSEQRRVFEPFFRGKSARDSQAPGSGLGLCVVRRVVEAQGGAVSVLSEPGAGSSFTLRLPRAPREPVA